MNRNPKIILNFFLHAGLGALAVAYLPTVARASTYESAWAQGKAKTSQVRLVSELKSLSKTTSEIKVGIEFQLKEGWHAYWKNPGTIGYAPKLKWTLPKSWSATDILFPAPYRLTVSTQPDAFAYGYEKKVTYPVILRGDAPQSPFSIRLHVDYLVCEIQCVPEAVDLELTLPVQDEELSAHAKAINELVEKAPQPTNNIEVEWKNGRQVSLFFKTQKIEDLFLYSTKTNIQNIKTVKIDESTWMLTSDKAIPSLEWTAVFNGVAGRTGISGLLKPAGSLNFAWTDFLWMLLFIFLGGAILNLMPCVLPVVFLKTVSVLKLSGSKHHVQSSLFGTIAGILSSFLVIAVLTIGLQGLGKEIGWGFQFQSPAFVTFMLLAIFLFAMNLFGVFDMNISADASTRISNLRGPFFEGVFATLLATPCSAPFLGTALTFALTQPPLLLALFFLTMGLGFSVPYILLLAAPETLRWLPKPGPWMRTLQRCLGYVFLLTILWLLYILHQQTSALFIFGALAALTGLFFFMREFHSPRRWLVVIGICLFTIAASEMWNRKTDASRSEETALTFSETDLQNRLNKGETLFVYITADWCITCKFNESTVIHTEWFEKMLKEQKVVSMKADWTQRDETIAAFLKKYGRVGIPFAMLITKEKTLVLPELLTRSVVEKKWKEFFSLSNGQ